MLTTTEKIRKILSEKIKAGDSQLKLAKETGLSQSSIYKYLETDTKITLDSIEKICKAYNIDIKQIVAEDSTEYRTRPPPITLTSEEIKLVKYYRIANEHIKNAAYQMLMDSANQTRGRDQEGAGHSSERKRSA